MEPYECWYYGIVTERVRNSQDAGNGYVTQKGHTITIRLNNRNMSDNKRQTAIRPSVLVSPGLRFPFDLEVIRKHRRAPLISNRFMHCVKKEDVVI